MLIKILIELNKLLNDDDIIVSASGSLPSDLERVWQTRVRGTYHLEYGFRHVSLPGRDEGLTLVVVRGFGDEPLMLLTSVAVKSSRVSLWFIVKGYLSRWMIEETIRFIKQCYNLEDIRVLQYDRLKNLAALVMTAAYFAAVWLGEKLRLAILCRRVAKLSKRFFGIPEFHCGLYARFFSGQFHSPGGGCQPQDARPPRRRGEHGGGDILGLIC